jgi:hypothetical protein
MQSQVVANFATSVVSDSLIPLDFMLTGEEARIRQASALLAEQKSLARNRHAMSSPEIAPRGMTRFQGQSFLASGRVGLFAL